jgi:hypothetical protein
VQPGIPDLGLNRGTEKQHQQMLNENSACENVFNTDYVVT